MRKRNNFFLFLFCVLGLLSLKAQEPDSVKVINERLDSLFIIEVEGKKGVEKVLHAEPLFIDLIRDLGAQKGEEEWNVGMGMTDNFKYDAYEVLVEYEFAPVNHLGLEVEVPLEFSSPQRHVSKDSIPPGKIESLKCAAQWSFFVSEKLKTTLALGYLNELEFADFKSAQTSSFVKGNLYNPFFIAAKRWGNNFHSLVYTGPRIQHTFKTSQTHLRYDINTNLHYMISGTRNFVGLELNKNMYKKDFDMVIRPQMRVSVANNFLVGIVAGVPVKRENQRLSMFIRLIWEPGHRVHQTFAHKEKTPKTTS